MKSVLILQNEIMEYRRPVYNALAEFYKITVVHAGRATRQQTDKYDEIIIPRRAIGGFTVMPQNRLSAHLKLYDVVVVMFDLRWPQYLLPAFQKHRPKFILWGHRYSKNAIANKVRDIIIKAADGVLLYGDEDIPAMIARGIDAKKLAVAWNTVEVENMQNLSTTEKDTLLFVGRLQPSKKIDLLIRSFSSMCASLPGHVQLNIVGAAANDSPGYDNYLKQLAQLEGAGDRIVFHGKVDEPTALRNLYARAYAYVSPGPVGLAVLHSFAYGVPVITMKNEKHGPERHNIIHNVNGILCDSQHALEDAIKLICSDRKYTEALGSRAFRHYEELRPLRRMIAGFVSAIEQSVRTR